MSFLEVIFMCIHPVYASIIQAIRRYHQEETMKRHKNKKPAPLLHPCRHFRRSACHPKFPAAQSHYRARLRPRSQPAGDHPSLRCRPSYRSCSGKPYGRRENLRLCGRHRRPSPGRAATGQPLLRPADRPYQRSRL